MSKNNNGTNEVLPRVELDEFDLEAMREAGALRRFRNEGGGSAQRTGRPKQYTRLRPCAKGTNRHHYKGAKTGYWKGLPSVRARVEQDGVVLQSR